MTGSDRLLVMGDLAGVGIKGLVLSSRFIKDSYLAAGSGRDGERERETRANCKPVISLLQPPS